MILKTTKIAAVAFAIAAASTFAIAKDEKSNAAQVQTSASTNIVIVDTQLIFDKSAAVQAVREQVDKKTEEYKNQYSKKEEYFKTKYDELEKQKATLSKEAFEKKNEELSKEFGDAQKKVQENRAALEKAYAEAMQQVDKTFVEIVKQEADKVGAKVVLHKMQTIYAEGSLEITDKVLESLNKKLSSVKVKF